ncbi:GATA zinc finger domain-containing protein 1 [Lamellibrachia satsuma]|nr:GATA zinc finger domain-containing protein 1 [Lamellibrachia satsuma]
MVGKDVSSWRASTCRHGGQERLKSQVVYSKQPKLGLTQEFVVDCAHVLSSRRARTCRHGGKDVSSWRARMWWSAVFRAQLPRASVLIYLLVTNFQTSDNNVQDRHSPSPFECKKTGEIPFGVKPMCETCKTTETTMWRKGADAEVLCNSCGLKQLKGGKGADDNSDNSGPKNGTGKAANGTGSQFVGRVRKSARLKPSKYKFQAATKALATKGKNRRVIFKKNPTKAPAALATIVTSDYIFYEGIYWQVGDIVSLMDHDGGIYYAQIRGFLQDQYCEKSAVITWLLPTVDSPTDTFDPATYILGAAKYREVNKKIKQDMRRAKDNWIAEQCCEMEDSLSKNNSKKAYQIVKDLTSVKKGRTTTIQDKSGKCLTEEQQILNRWTEYCSELYSHNTNGDPVVLNCPQTTEEDDYPILREEVEAAVKSLKKGKSAGIDNIPAELVQTGGEALITTLTTICNKIWQTGEWPTPWTQSLIITLPKKGNLQMCQNYRTISLISHPSKVMLKILLNRLKPQAEEIIAEEQAGFRAGRSTIEQIFNLRILCEKHLQHQQSLYHVFIDFKKAFDKVWHAALWATMRKYNIGSKLVRTIEHLYDNATSAVTFNSSIGDWFRTTVGVRQGCLLSPTLFNIFLERIMTDALENHQGTVSIGGRTITNLRFADDIDGLAGDEQELVNLVERLEKTSSSYGMEISAEKTKLMTNSTQGISTEVKVNGQRLEAVTSFRYLGSIITDEGSKPEILARIAQTTAAQTRLKPLWNDRNITVSSKIRLMRSLVMSIFLYACETWTLSADLQKRIQAMEMRCFRKILHISYKDHVTNDAVRNKIKQAIGPYDDLLTTVKKRKLKWYDHVSRSCGLAKIILQGTVRGGRRRGRQKKRWEDNIKEWTGMEFADSQRAVENRETWRELVRKSSMVPQRSLWVMGK